LKMDEPQKSGIKSFYSVLLKDKEHRNQRRHFVFFFQMRQICYQKIN